MPSCPNQKSLSSARYPPERFRSLIIPIEIDLSAVTLHDEAASTRYQAASAVAIGHKLSEKSRRSPLLCDQSVSQQSGRQPGIQCTPGKTHGIARRSVKIPEFGVPVSFVCRGRDAEIPRVAGEIPRITIRIVEPYWHAICLIRQSPPTPGSSGLECISSLI